MRTFLLLMRVINASGIIEVQAQTSIYHPFPDSNAVWNERYSDNYHCDFGGECYTGDYFSYVLNVDTLINGKKYEKLYIPKVIHDTLSFLICGSCDEFWRNAGYTGGIRQDTVSRKIWFFQRDSAHEQLLYNFNATVGDTISYFSTYGYSCHAGIVSTIDSIRIGADYRKRWKTIDYEQIIEGIGSINGLLESECDYGGGATHIATFLLCFKQNGLTLYPDTLSSCDVMLQVEYISKQKSSVLIYPNPFHITASFNTSVEKCELKIYNTIGLLMGEETINNHSTTINRNTLSNGIYFYQLINDKGEVARGKFVVD